MGWIIMLRLYPCGPWPYRHPGARRLRCPSTVPPSALKRLLLGLIFAPLLALLALAGWGWWWVGQPLALPAGTTAEQPLALSVAPGQHAKAVVRSLVNAGVDASPLAMAAWFRLSGKGGAIKAGEYEIQPGATPRSLLNQLVRGEQALRSVTFVEGWNIRQVLAALRASPDLTQDLEGLSAPQIAERIGVDAPALEGVFFPDTYRVPKKTPASSVLRQAAAAMNERLAQAWSQRSPDSALKTPQDALILASIIEKETGAAADRAMIGGVFNNRLRIGMRLQTDPTVIYGLGEAFNGNLRRVDLLTDTAYNTYTRAGLPPTPIAMPGWDSLLAAVRPAETRALYFVARGDGSSEFSESLDQHNGAVRRFQLQR